MSEYEVLLAAWRGYLEEHQGPDGFTRDAGFRAGLRVCIQQLAETIERVKAADDE